MCVLSLASMLLVSGACGDSPSVGDETALGQKHRLRLRRQTDLRRGLKPLTTAERKSNSLIPDDSAGRWSAKELDAESENGDVLNDAVFKRDTIVEEKQRQASVGAFYP